MSRSFTGGPSSVRFKNISFAVRAADDCVTVLVTAYQLNWFVLFQTISNSFTVVEYSARAPAAL